MSPQALNPAASPKCKADQKQPPPQLNEGAGRLTDDWGCRCLGFGLVGFNSARLVDAARSSVPKFRVSQDLS
ncbi:MAG: hypothetical protein BJG00_011820 [Limnothrix sp. CACIAM 69d]|nr:MAG: hypothetical protein BJG00_011820 [Limnothrix sp. CACIAM 69d]